MEKRKAIITITGDLSILIHCDPDILRSWLTVASSPSPSPSPSSLPNPNHTRNLVPAKTAPYHLAAGHVAPLHAASRQEEAPPVPPYHHSNFCRHCLHHNNCHYTDDRAGDTYCTACANAKCHKLPDSIEFDEPAFGVKIQ